MIALDTNILIALHRGDAAGHGVATQARIFAPPSTLAQALEAIARWRIRATVRFLHEDDSYWTEFAKLAVAGGITGPRIHDAHIAALCLHHGVRELWTADRDFSRFPRLRTRNPLVPL